MKKCYTLYLGAKWVTKIKVVPLCLLCNVCKDSHKMGKWFAPNAVRRSHGLEGTKTPLVRLLLLFNRQNTDYMQI